MYVYSFIYLLHVYTPICTSIISFLNSAQQPNWGVVCEFPLQYHKCKGS